MTMKNLIFYDCSRLTVILSNFSTNLTTTIKKVNEILKQKYDAYTQQIIKRAIKLRLLIKNNKTLSSCVL